MNASHNVRQVVGSYEIGFDRVLNMIFNSQISLRLG